MTKIITQPATVADLPQVAGHSTRRGNRKVHRSTSELLNGYIGRTRSAFFAKVEDAASFLNGDDTNLYSNNPLIVRMQAMRR